MQELEQLELPGLKVTDEGSRDVAALTSLKFLALPDSDLTDEGLAHLGNLRHLEFLLVSGQITDHGLKYLAKLESLYSLTLGTRTVTEAALTELRGRLPRLQYAGLEKPHESPLEPPKVGQVASDFEVKTLDGNTFRLRDQRGKAVLLHFWATWCAPCIKNTPELRTLNQALSTKYKQFTMISLSADRQDDSVRRHIEREKLTWPQARIGLDSKIAEEYGVSSVPAFFVIGPDGKIAAALTREEEITAAVTKMLGAQAETSHSP